MPVGRILGSEKSFGVKMPGSRCGEEQAVQKHKAWIWRFSSLYQTVEGRIIPSQIIFPQRSSSAPFHVLLLIFIA